MRKMFDFECKKCNHVEEKLFKEGDIIVCTNCGSDELEKVISPIKSFQFKGDGFYETDFKHK